MPPTIVPKVVLRICVGAAKDEHLDDARTRPVRGPMERRAPAVGNRSIKQ
jgi:hypothetical protein